MGKTKYIFIVGFPRSGTTLTQSLVMCDDSVYSIPETHIFTKGIKTGRLPECIYNLWTTWYCYRWIKRHFSQQFIFYSPSRNKLIKAFFHFLESKAKAKHKAVILEKTPAHLNQIELISSIFTDAQFIHVTRPYQSALPSKLKAAKQWGGNTDKVHNMRRWVSEVFLSINYSENHPNHLLVDYQELIGNRARVVDRINQQFGLGIGEVTDEKLTAMSKLVVDPNEPWKQSNLLGYRVDAEPEMELNSTFKKFVNYINNIQSK